MEHSNLGPYISYFRIYKAIPLKAKVFSVSLLWITILISVFFILIYCETYYTLVSYLGRVFFCLVTAIIFSCSYGGRYLYKTGVTSIDGLTPERDQISALKIIASDDFSEWKNNWALESEKGFSIDYYPIDTLLDIVAEKGLTLWYKKPFKGNIRISLEAYVPNQGDSMDRVSDMNFFWCATDPENPDNLFANKDFRNGVFGKYYSLSLYYMGFGGNSNTTTRFRKYDGDYDGFTKLGKRPGIIVEYTDTAHLIKPNHWYTIEIVINEGRVRYLQDNDILVDYLDAKPLSFGWFGVRTTENHMRIRHFVVQSL